MKTSIRPLKEEDLAKLRKLILEAENFGQPFIEPELHNLKWYSIPDLGAVYVAALNDEPVGYIIPGKKVFAATIVSMIVEKNPQRKGIGKALIEKAKEYAKSH